MWRYCQTIMLWANICLVTYLKKEALRNGQIYPFTWMSPFTNRTYYVSHRCPFTAFMFWRDPLEAEIDTGRVFAGDLGSITSWPCGLQFPGRSGTIAPWEDLTHPLSSHIASHHYHHPHLPSSFDLIKTGKSLPKSFGQGHFPFGIFQRLLRTSASIVFYCLLHLLW